METSTLEGPVHPATMQGMPLFETIASMGHEQLVLCQDAASGYRGIIAIHSTVLGPALGGTRFWSYASDDEAIVDALRLARGMTYKNAVAGLNLGPVLGLVSRNESHCFAGFGLASKQRPGRQEMLVSR